VCNGAIVAIRRLAHGRDDALAGSITQLSKEFGDQSKPIELFAIGDVEHPFACAKTAIDGHAASLIDLICGSDPVAVCASLPHGRQRASLLPPTLRAEHQRARWRKAARYAAAAAFALAIAFGARVYRIQDALAAERTQRARITAAVRESLALMDTMNALQREWRLVRDGDPKMRERWGTIAALSRMLPRGAWLRSIRLRGDTVFITGNALSAEEVFVALQRAPEFLSPRFTAPIDLETISGDDANEHFALRAGVSVGGDILQSGRTTRSKIGVSF
jgi:hypothetical protein